MKKSILFVAIFYSIASYSQTNKALLAAFSQSHEYELNLKYDAAISALNAVYNEKSYELNLRLAWLNYAAGKNKESVAFYQKAEALMPAATEPLWGIINPLTKLENWTEIEKTYLAILKIDSKDATANYYLGLIYYYRKDYINAKKFIETSLNLAPFNYLYMLMSAWSNYFLGNKNEAHLLFDKVLLYSPNDKSALEGLALIK